VWKNRGELKLGLGGGKKTVNPREERGLRNGVGPKSGQKSCVSLGGRKLQRKRGHFSVKWENKEKKSLTTASAKKKNTGMNLRGGGSRGARPDGGRGG